MRDIVATRDALPSGAFSMSFRAVAAFMLDAVQHRTHVHQIVGLGSSRIVAHIGTRLKVTPS